MNVHVVIPSHKRPDLLNRTLVSLAECRLPAGYSGTIVIENGGRYGAERVAAAAAEHLNVRYLYHEAGNKSAALNVVLENVGDELLVFFDDDVRLEPGVLKAYASAAAEEPRPAFFGGPVACDYEVDPFEWIVLPPSARGWSLSQGTEYATGPHFLGFNWAAYADDLRECGGFDPDVGPGGRSGSRGQERDMQMRLVRAGFVARYVPDALVWHYVPTERCSQEWSLKRAYQNGIGLGLEYDASTVKRLLGIPRWTFRELFRRYVRMQRIPRSEERKRYEAAFEFHTMRGFMIGCRYAAQSSRREPVPAEPVASKASAGSSSVNYLTESE